MYVLNKKATPAEADGWLTLFPAVKGKQAAVRVRFGRITRPIRDAATKEAARVYVSAGKGVEPDDVMVGEAGEAYGSAILRHVILEWEGLGDPKRKAVAVTPETIEDFLDDDGLYERAYELVVIPDLIRQAEKKGLRLSPNGIGAGTTRAKRTASSRRAKPQSTGAAPNARTSRTSPKPKKAS